MTFKKKFFRKILEKDFLAKKKINIIFHNFILSYKQILNKFLEEFRKLKLKIYYFILFSFIEKWIAYELELNNIS